MAIFCIALLLFGGLGVFCETLDRGHDTAFSPVCYTFGPLPRLLYEMRVFLLLFLLAVQLPGGAAPQDPATRARSAEARLQQHPNDADSLFEAAFALQQMQQLDRAERYYRQLIALRPDWPEPRNNLAIIHLKKGDYDGAIDLLISSLKTHPAYETAWRNLSNLYQGLASEAYRRALSEDKNTRSVLDRIRLQPLARSTGAVTAAAPPAPEPPAAPVPAKPPAARPAPQPPEPNIRNLSQRIQQIRQSVLDWADAWTRKDLDAYVSAYAPAYRDGKPNHEAWVAWRRQRILRPGDIRVSISDIRIRHHDDHQARVDFVQTYRSPNYRDRVVKRLDMTRIDGDWKIVREKTLRVLQSP
jgi:tetratricopeptide (TPR) repeat protein